MKKRISKKTKSILAALSIVAIVGVSGVVAYLTDNDDAKNTFTVGNVQINLVEDNWDPTNAQNIVPGQNIVKDPKVKNEGKNPAYVYLEVKVPVATVETAQDNGTPVAAARTQLFTYTVDTTKWTKLDAYTDETQAGYNKYVYAYYQAVPVAGETTTLFDEVKFANVTQTIAGNQDIDIKAVAIQSEALPSGTTIAQAYGIYLNQNPPANP